MSLEEEEMIACIPPLRRYARALLGGIDAADDLVQETLRKAWEKRHSWRRGSTMRVWLFGIMHNSFVDQWRKAEPAMTSWEEEIQEPLVPMDGTVERIDLEAALKRLPQDHREILLLVALEGLTYAETATATGLPLGTVMSRLSRGREKLRKLISPASPEDWKAEHHAR